MVSMLASPTNAKVVTSDVVCKLEKALSSSCILVNSRGVVRELELGSGGEYSKEWVVCSSIESRSLFDTELPCSTRGVGSEASRRSKAWTLLCCSNLVCSTALRVLLVSDSMIMQPCMHICIMIVGLGVRDSGVHSASSN